MKKTYLMLMMLLASITLFGCGGDDDPVTPTPTPTPTVTAPTVVSTTPANNATDIATGNVSVTITYDKEVIKSSDASLQPQVSGGTLSNAASVSGKDLTFTVNCPDYSTKVTITIPKGLIGVTGALAEAFTLSFTTKAEVDPGTTDNDATALAKKLGWGWNLGNHFDTSSGQDGVHPQWGYWDNATPSSALYTTLKSIGASTVRIGVTWGNYQDSQWNIEASYIAEIKQNVEWAEAAGLNVILNMHHDEYWQNIKEAASNNIVNDQIKDRIAKTWKQIAEAFKDKGDFLIFESFNEIHVEDNNGNWLNPTTKQLTTLNEWNQTVVNSIRATGGNNATRWIGVPGFAASPANVLNDSFVLPTDAANRLMVSVHFYDPYLFTLQPEGNNGKSEWGHTAAAGKYQSGSNEDHVIDTFKKLYEKYVVNNIPVYIGEYGCVQHNNDRSNKFRNYYLEYVCRAAHTYSMPCVIWDNNAIGGGNEHHGYINHSNGNYLNDSESLVKTMIKATTSDDASYTLESIYNSAPK